MLLRMKWITNENILYRTRHSTQCPVVTEMGRKSNKRGDICIHIPDSLCHTAETQYCKATIHQWKKKLKIAETIEKPSI